MRKNSTKLSTIPLIGICLLIGSCSSLPKKPDSIQDDGYAYPKEYVTAYVRNIMEKQNIPSVLVAMIDDDTVVWKEAFGYSDFENKIPATSSTVYKIASVSKAFTGLAIMQLYEQGLIDLDAPVTEYLPDFSMKSRFEDKSPIAILSLLSHRAGIPDGPFYDYIAKNSENRVRKSIEEEVASLKETYVAYPVGYTYKYSSYGFIILARIVETVSGMEFPEYIRKNIFEPVGMNSSSFLSNPVIDKKLAKMYATYDGQMHSMDIMDLSELGAGNMYTTLDDMTRFIRCMLQGGEIDGKRILKEATLKKSYEKPFAKPTDPFLSGLGWHGVGNLSSGDRIVYGAGGHRGFVASITFMPERKLGLIILSNGNDYQDSREELALETIALMLESKTGIKQIEEYPLTPVEVKDSLLERYRGTYLTSNYGDLRVYKGWFRKMKLAFGGYNFNLTPETQNSFRVTHPLTDVGYITLTFFPDDPVQGDIAVLNLHNQLFSVGRKHKPIARTPLWDRLVGDYVIEENETSSGGKWRIRIEDNLLRIRMEYLLYSHDIVLNPLNEWELVMVDGHWAGETIKRDPETGCLSWSGVVAKPVKKTRKRNWNRD